MDDDDDLGDMKTMLHDFFMRAPGRRWRSALLAGTLVPAVLSGAWSVGAPASSGVATGAPDVGDAIAKPTPDVAAMLDRARRAERVWTDVEAYYESRVRPLERVLLQYRDSAELVRRVAVALVRHANVVGVEPRLLLAVLLVENPWIDPDARSSVGAVGLMQVMPQHRGQWGPCLPDLEDVEANICHGARIFAHYYRQTGGDVERALLRYNGCVNGTNTPDCHRYPYHVYARAGRASILAWLRPQPVRAITP